MSTKTRSARAVGAIVAAAVTIGVFASTADARVPKSDPRVDSLAAACGAVQDKWDGLKAQRDGATNAADKAKYQDAMNALENGQWKGPCSDAFGSIAARRPGSVRNPATLPLEPIVQVPTSDHPTLQLNTASLPSTATENHSYLTGSRQGAVPYPG